MNPKLQSLIGIMAFYAILTYVIFPLSFYYFKRTLASAGNGFIAGSLVSILLWLNIGQKMI